MKKKIIIVFTSIILISYVARVYYVNAMGYHLETERYAMGSTYELDDFNLMIKGVQILSKDEFQKRYDTSFDFFPDKEYRVAELELDVEYIGNQEQAEFNSFFRLMAGSYRQGCTSLSKINGSDTIVKKGEHRILYRFSPIVKSTVTKKEYDNLNKFKFEIAVKNYPKEVIMLCY